MMKLMVDNKKKYTNNSRRNEQNSIDKKKT